MISSDAQIKTIRQGIRSASQQIRQQYPILQYQNAIGVGILFFSIVGILGTGYAYWRGDLPVWLTIPLIALFMSLTHELEHDLIHWMYFKDNPLAHHTMMALVWLCRPGTINPWIRRRLHLRHHQVSGTSRDIEERGIGNGRPYGWLRMWIMFDTFLGNLVANLMDRNRTHRVLHIIGLFVANFPLAWLNAAIWYGFWLLTILLGGSGLGWLIVDTETLAAWSRLQSELSVWVVVMCAPFYLRSFSINFISSNMHYYGDVDNLLKQTQVLNAWYFWPLQLFCFNFGSTHGIHHFWVNEPFYIRQLSAPVAHRLMRENGVRFNDIATFKRNNRYQSQAEAAPAQT